MIKSEKTNENVAQPESTVRIGKNVYIVKRHFSGERDIREAVYTAVKNEAFHTSE